MTSPATVPSRAYLDVQDLSIRAGSKILVNGLSFSAEKGRVTGLVGESGCGKSLTCQTIMGLPPRGLSVTGKVSLNGIDMPLSPGKTALARDTRGRQVAMIMQNPISCFNPVCTIQTHFKETLAAHKAFRPENTRQRWISSLAKVGFEEPDAILSLYPFQMSGGMLQRVMIALALALDVDFLLADEATTDLDAVSQRRVLDLVISLVRDRGLGVLLVTHDLSVIAHLADEMLVMREGELLEKGSVNDIFHQPRASYTISLLESHYRLYGIDRQATCNDESTGNPL